MPEPDEKTQRLVRETAGLFGKLFINRRDRKAIFRPDHTGKWHWTAIDDKFTMGDFHKHLTGTHCLGTYLLNTDSTVKFLAFDFDVRREGKFWYVYDSADGEAEMSLDVQEGPLESALHDPTQPAYRWVRLTLLEGVRHVTNAVRDQFKMSSMTVITGGGAHVLVPFPEPVPAADARSAAIAILNGLPHMTQRNDIFFDYGPLGEISVEVFPKQDSMDGKEYGNLIRLPYGWHYEAAMRTYSIDPVAETVPLWNFRKVKSSATLRELAQKVGVA